MDTHNVAIGRRNHERMQTKKIDICENHLFIKGNGKEIQNDDFKPKVTQNHISLVSEGESEF